MKLDINKDFLSYKDEAFKGYTFFETVAIGVALAGSIGTCYCMVYYFKTSVNVGMYSGMLGVASPILLLGFYKYQGMSCFQLLKEVIYVEKTKLLIRDVDEYQEGDYYFSMKK